jgi:hypothetical protein
MFGKYITDLIALLNIVRSAMSSEQIEIISMYYLILQFPSLSSYIEHSFNNGYSEDMLDFIFALVTEDEPQVH